MKFEGAIPALLTPFGSAGNVDEDRLRRLVELHLKAGATGLSAWGSLGEGLLLKTEGC